MKHVLSPSSFSKLQNILQPRDFAGKGWRHWSNIGLLPNIASKRARTSQTWIKHEQRKDLLVNLFRWFCQRSSSVRSFLFDWMIAISVSRPFCEEYFNLRSSLKWIWTPEHKHALPLSIKKWLIYEIMLPVNYINMNRISYI